VKARNIGLFGLLVAVLFSVQASAIGADAKKYWIGKEQYFTQTNAAAPTLITPGFEFDCGVDSWDNTPGLLLAGTLQLPDGSTVSLTPYEVDGDLDFENQWFATEAAMDAAFPNGTCTFTVETAHDGTRILPLTLTGNAYPTTPHITNWTASQNVNPDADFTLVWNAFTGGATDDYIRVRVAYENADDPVYQSPEYSDLNRLTGTNSSFTIPAGILLPGTNCDVSLEFYKLADWDTTSYPNAVGVSSYGKRTDFTLRTTVGTVVQWPASQGGNGHWYKAVLASSGITWYNAQNIATSVGGYLATITSAAENEFVYSLVASNSAYWVYDDAFNQWYGPWLGGFQPPRFSGPAAGWEWVTGETWNYTNWCTGEPNDYLVNENALQFIGRPSITDFCWNDNYGSNEFNSFIIEFDSNPNPAAPSITTSSPLPSGVVGTAYSQTLQATGGTTPYGWSVVSNSLPAGLGLVAGSGAITGTPTVATTANFTVRVSDANSQSSEKDFSLTINPPPVPHDLAILSIKAPKKITLTSKKPSVTSSVIVQIQNRSPVSEVISNATVLANLVTLSVEPIAGACPGLTPVLQVPTTFPITLKSKGKLTVLFNVTFSTNCVPDALQTSKTAPHNDYRYIATVHHDAINGVADSHPACDVCPRGSLPGGVDPYPDGKLKDKGCGGKNSDGTLGADILTDVVVK